MKVARPFANFANAIKFLCIALTCMLCASACSVNKENQESETPSTEASWVEELKGDPGIIGEVNFLEIPIYQYPEVNLIQVYDRKNSRIQAQATGTRLRDKKNRRDYIVTVAHLFNYEFDGDHQNFLLYIGKNGEFDGGSWFRISPRLYSIIDPAERDTILIPVDYDLDASAYDITKAFPEKIVSLPEHVVIVSSVNLPYDKKIRKLKQSADLLAHFNIGSGNWKTDADLFLGMSGSPTLNANQQLVGLVSRVSKTQNCNEYGGLSCYNLIAPIDPSWIRQQISNHSGPKLFKLIEE